MTQPNAQCPQCAAPLPAGAARCNFCGFVTPWGAVLSQQQQRAGAIYADQAKRARAAKIQGNARTGMILAIVGLPICCGPLSIVGGALGWKAAREAKAEGIARPVTALLAMIIAAVSTVTFIVGLTMYIRDQREKAAHLAGVQSRLEGKRDAAVLDPKVACDLVEEHLTEKGYGDNHFNLGDVHCDGALAVTDRRATAPDVRFAFGDKHFTITACLEKRSRWFVIKILDSGSCAELPPAAPFTEPARKLSDAEIAADETKAISDMANAAGIAAVKQYTDRLAKVAEDARGPAGAESTCAKTTMAKYVTGDSRRKVPTIDFDFLAGSKGGNSSAWGILTSESVRKILDEKRSAVDRSTSVTELRTESGPLLVVYKSSGTKSWPVIKGKDGTVGKDFSYTGGEYEGWLLVYDVDTAARLCQTKLVFESSDVVNFRKSRFGSAKGSAKDAVEDDFKDRFETTATDAIKRAAPDLRLDYKLLE